MAFYSQLTILSTSLDKMGDDTGKEEHDNDNIIAMPFLSQQVLSKTTVIVKTAILRVLQSRGSER